MAQLAAGKFRWVAKFPNGNRKAKSGAIPYDQFDNTTSPFTVFRYEGREQFASATDSDYTVELPSRLVAVGSKNQMLDLEFYHTAATTPDTSAHTVDFHFLEITAQGTDLKPVALGDRADPAGNGVSHQNGWPDDTGTVPNDWSTVLRFIPPNGTNWAPHGRMNFTYDAT